eukprot:snap_masked-scaffold_47-processed-gene-0.27-mRNA-1 protein AED:1.00 eAED:1.00 QI:0/0/0/0/1/1/2/0/97
MKENLAFLFFILRKADQLEEKVRFLDLSKLSALIHLMLTENIMCSDRMMFFFAFIREIFKNEMDVEEIIKPVEFILQLLDKRIKSGGLSYLIRKIKD